MTIDPVEVMFVKGKFVIERTRDDAFVYKLLSEAEEVLAVSDAFETLPACRSGVTAARGSLGSAVVETDHERAVDGKSYYDVFSNDWGYTFLLKGYFGEVLMAGSFYEGKDDCLRVIDQLHALEPDEDVDYRENLIF